MYNFTFTAPSVAAPTDNSELITDIEFELMESELFNLLQLPLEPETQALDRLFAKLDLPILG